MNRETFKTLARKAGNALSPSDDVRRYVLMGFAVVVALTGSLGVWAATTELAGAVIASGTVVVDGSSKKVQHPTGGIIGELLARDGDVVEAGQILVRLDETVTKANLYLITNQLDEIAIRTARLTAEIEGRSTLEF
ncbi:MAG: biotin/lipoyl-binding protein, partial [Hyphomicrobiales bacterium]